MKLLITIILFLLFQSCNSKDEHKQLESSLHAIVSSNQFIKKSSSTLYQSLQNKADEIQTKVAALIWLEKLKELNESTNRLIRCIDSLSDNPKMGSESGILQSKIKSYANYLESISLETKESNLIDSTLIKFNQQNIINLFDKFNYEEIKLNLEALKNSIYLTENNLIQFANNRAESDCVLTYKKFSVLIEQNSLHFMQGDELTISAGVGSYSLSSAPTFIVGANSILKPDENGIARFRKKIVEKAGKYKIPVVIKYVNQDGEMKSFERQIDYEVH